MSWDFVGLDDLDVYDVAFPADGSILAAVVGGGRGVYRSTDNGVTWEERTFSGFAVHSLAVDSTGGVYGGTYRVPEGGNPDIAHGGVVRSFDNGLTWEVAINGISNSPIYSLSTDSADFMYAGTPRNGIFRSTDGGLSWQSASDGLVGSPDINAIAVSATGSIYAGTISGAFVSYNNGLYWQSITGLPGGEIKTIMLDGSGQIFVGFSFLGIYRSSDNGQNWSACNNGLSDLRVYSIATNDAGVLYAGTRYDGLFRSEDNGDTWVTTDILDMHIWAILTADDGAIYVAAYWGGVYKSDDGGYTWTYSGLVNQKNVSLWEDVDGNLYVGTIEYGIYRSSDLGVSWTLFNNGLSCYSVRAFSERTNGQVIAGTSGGGVFGLVNCSDTDGDSWCDTEDVCPEYPDPGQEETDGDGIGDACDNCPDDYNPGQEDSNSDGIGDVCVGCCQIAGDVDNTGQLDISDLVYLVDYMFTGGPAPPCQDQADVDDSGGIDIADLVYIVDFMFNQGPAPICGTTGR